MNRYSVAMSMVSGEVRIHLSTVPEAAIPKIERAMETTRLKISEVVTDIRTEP